MQSVLFMDTSQELVQIICQYYITLHLYQVRFQYFVQFMYWVALFPLKRCGVLLCYIDKLKRFLQVMLESSFVLILFFFSVIFFRSSIFNLSPIILVFAMVPPRSIQSSVYKGFLKDGGGG